MAKDRLALGIWLHTLEEFQTRVKMRPQTSNFEKSNLAKHTNPSLSNTPNKVFFLSDKNDHIYFWSPALGFYYRAFCSFSFSKTDFRQQPTYYLKWWQDEHQVHCVIHLICGTKIRAVIFFGGKWGVSWKKFNQKYLGLSTFVF